MTIDLVFPKNNEKALVTMAKKLGFGQLFLAYSIKTPNIQEKIKEVKTFSSETLRVELAILVDTQADIQKAKKITPTTIAPSKQEFYEDKRVRFIIVKDDKKKDFIHNRRGFTQVNVKNCIRTNKTILVNFADINNSITLGRLQQNNILFKKFKPSVFVISGATQPLEMRAPRDLSNILNL